MTEKIIIYTDGSCIWNPWKWWWCALLKFKNKEKIISWSCDLTTNNQMELTALIKALEQIKTQKYPIEIWTDSKYVLDWITKWIKKWKENWWKTANKNLVKNKELWEKLDELINKYDVKIHWVKAHANDDLNNLVDKIAREKAKQEEI